MKSDFAEFPIFDIIISMIDPTNFQTTTLSNHLQGEHITSILSAAIEAVEPGKAVSRFVKLDQNRLVCGDHLYHLDQYERVYLLAFGKAAMPMSAALVEILGNHLTRGWLVPKHESGEHDPRLIIQPGSHPLPDENSLKAGEMLLSAAASFTEKDLVFCLISGGGSALVTAPYAGVTLADLRELTSQLLDCGARIDEINTLRRHLDRIKGGGLAKHVSPATLVESRRNAFICRRVFYRKRFGFLSDLGWRIRFGDRPLCRCDAGRYARINPSIAGLWRQD